MFRKFLKALPKEDGKSDLDRQTEIINQTIHLWKDEDRELLAQLVQPVPKLFRQVAKEAIAGKIGSILINEKADKLSKDAIIRGYILATPKRDHKALYKRLDELRITYERTS